MAILLSWWTIETKSSFHRFLQWDNIPHIIRLPKYLPIGLGRTFNTKFVPLHRRRIVKWPFPASSEEVRHCLEQLLNPPSFSALPLSRPSALSQNSYRHPGCRLHLYCLLLALGRSLVHPELNDWQARSVSWTPSRVGRPMRRIVISHNITAERRGLSISREGGIAAWHGDNRS